MATTTNAFSLIFFLTLFIISVIINGKPTLLASDRNALFQVQKQLGVKAFGQRFLNRPCDSPGLSCERRRGVNDSDVMRVTRVVYESKKLRGRLSSKISKLSELKELSLANNHLVGQIPGPILACTQLVILDLRGNHFSGPVSFELSSLHSLRILDLSSNSLSGDLNFLRYFPNLEKLSISDNLFSGIIPPSLNSLPNLRVLNLSGNPLLISPENAAPRRYIFAETNKNTTTKAPSSAQPPEPKPQPEQKHESKKGKRKLKGWIIGFVAGAIAGSLCGLLVSSLFRMMIIRGRGKASSLTIFSPVIKKAEDLSFLEKEDGLESLEIIGRGGCGEVYRAQLPGSEGMLIAIKKIIQPPKDAAELTEENSKMMNKKMRQIKSEIQIVGQIRHRNLLPLLAHMPRPDCHYLVYEFMKNGSLQDALQAVAEGRRELDWLGRHRIAVGIAAGLEYLHFNHTQRIIHRDLKPANVLLDDDMEARIADFGLAKVVPDAHTHITTSIVAGTAGYIAPEYHQTLKFTDKCDVYSFGVVLGVLVMGKLPSDEFFQHTSEMSIVKWLRKVMTSEDPKQAIDPKMLGNGYEEQMLLVLKISCFCTLDNPKERPNSKDIRCMLTQIKH